MKWYVYGLIGLVGSACITRASFAQPPKAPEAVAVAAAPAPNKPKVRPLTVTVDLTNNVVIGGTITDATQLTMKTSFGEASIPMTEIAGIRFASSDDVSTTVVMLNGDTITGATDVKIVTVDTEWGTAKINGSNIKSIMFVPGLSWSATNGLNGKRWTLSEGKAAATPTAPNTPGRTIGPGNGITSGRAIITQ